MIRSRTIRQRAGQPTLWSAVCQHRFLLDGAGVFYVAAPSKAVLTDRTPKGFTLIEMLMAVTLVLIMMVMFAEVFQIAGNSVTKQRTLADNDQNARTFVTILRADLDKRTSRSLIPYYPGEPVLDSQNTNRSIHAGQVGYFYISNNNVGDGTDDLLQFTMMSTVSQRNADETPYYGAAAQLFSGSGLIPAYDFLANPNQPDRDDGQMIANGAASSRAAEVAYWMRGGRLYRRVMLIRDPLKTANVDPTSPAQPKTVTGVDYFIPSPPAPVPPYVGNFWGQFDFSAFYGPSALVPGYMPAGARFVGLDFLRNDLPPAFPPPPPPSLAPPIYCYSLGQSWNRFGFNSQFAGPGSPSLTYGLSREFSSATAPNFFIGRFTHEETSGTEDTNGNGVLDPGEDTNSNGVLDKFNYPQSLLNGNPMDAATMTYTDADGNGVVDESTGGGRAGVDLLLSNVHEFRVELWDERFAGFTAIGNSSNPTGDFASGRNLNPAYAPLGGFANNFDTWHPNFDRNVDGLLGASAGGTNPDHPPYRPMTYDPTGTSAPMPPPNSGGSPYWQPSTQYKTGDIVFEPPQNLPPAYNEKLLLNRQVPYYNFAVYYKCLGRVDRNPDPPAQPGTSSNAYPSPSDSPPMPNFPTTVGTVFSDDDKVSRPNGLRWQAVYNLRPLKAIRITVRFMHPTSRQMKQVSIVHSLRDTTAVP